MKSQRNNTNLAIMILVFIITPVIAINFKMSEDRYEAQKLEKVMKNFEPPRGKEMILKKGAMWVEDTYEGVGYLKTMTAASRPELHSDYTGDDWDFMERNFNDHVNHCIRTGKIKVADEDTRVIVDTKSEGLPNILFIEGVHYHEVGITMDKFLKHR